MLKIADSLIDESLTIKQVAKKIGLHEKTILKYIKRGELKAIKFKQWYIKPKDLEDFLKRRSNISEE